MYCRTRRLSVRFRMVHPKYGSSNSMAHAKNNCRLSLRLDNQRLGNAGIHHTLHFYRNLDLLDGPSNRIWGREIEKPEAIFIPSC